VADGGVGMTEAIATSIACFSIYALRCNGSFSSVRQLIPSQAL